MPALLKLPGAEEQIEMTHRWLRGEYEVPDGEIALYYRVRGIGDAAPTFVAMEFLERSLSDSLEDGTILEETEISSVVQELSVGGTSVNSRGSWGARGGRPCCGGRATWGCGSAPRPR